MKAAIYNTTTGEILRDVIGPASQIDLQCAAGEEFYLNCPADVTHIIDNLPVTIIPEVIPPTPEELLLKIRQKRNALLSACDWTQLEDSPVDKQGWKVYRKALRDFPETCDINNPVWPVRPL